MDAITHGIQFAVVMLLFVGAGYWIDKKLGTFPLFLIICLFLGFGLALYSLILNVNRMRNREKEREKEKKNDER